MLYGHGDDGYRYRGEITADFSTNVWYGGEPGGLKEHLFARWSVINRYPEVLAEDLGRKIAHHHHFDATNILVTNGTMESIYLIAHAFKGGETSIVFPSFAEYEDACRIHDQHIRFLDWNAINVFSKLNSSLIFICHPNNPTGLIFDDLQTIIENNPDTIFVIDEAFIEFTFSAASLIRLVSDHKNVIILRSMTKAFAIPGLRLGYIAAPAPLIGKLTSYKMPWAVNALAIEAGHFIFDNLAVNKIPLRQLLHDKEDFVHSLQQVAIRTHRSHTHFFLAEIPFGTAKELKQYLVDFHRILIRDASNFRGLNDRQFRLATLSPSKNGLLVAALQQWQQQHS